MAEPVVLFHRLAAADYRLALAWYRRRSVSAAQRFRSEVDRVVEQIASSPERGMVFRGSYRWMRVRRFPYLIFYEVVDPGLIRVYAVSHGRRRLGYWIRTITRP